MSYLDDLPYDEYQKEMARIEAENAEKAKNAEMGIETLEENEDHSGFDSFLGGGDDESPSGGVDLDAIPPDQAGDTGIGDPEVVTAESNPEAFEAGKVLQEKMDENAALKKAGMERTLSGAFQNFLGGIKGLFTGGVAAGMQTVANIGAKLGLPKAATYGLIFILGGGTFAGMAALFSHGNDNYKYAGGEDDCQIELNDIFYHENSVYKPPTQDQVDGSAGALFNALNSDMHFQYAIRDGGTNDDITDDVSDDGYVYNYTQDPEDRYDWNEDGEIDEDDDRSREIAGGYHDYDHFIEKFQDEQILGMIMAASAESHIDPSTYEMNYRVGPPDEDSPMSTDFYLGLSNLERDMILSRTHHVQWNAYCLRMFELYAEDGLSINEAAYEYHDQWGSTTNDEGQQNYYPGVGLFQWTGQRGYNLHWFANHLQYESDADGDGANDAMYSLNVQVVYMLEIEANPVVVNGEEIPITEWGHEIESTYQIEYYVDVPYKPSLGTAPGMEANWVPMHDYTHPDERDGMQVPWDAYHQLRQEYAKYKYESKTSARLSDKNADLKRDAAYFQDSDRYDGALQAFDDAPFPVKDYLYNDDGSISKDRKYKKASGTYWDDKDGDGIEADDGSESLDIEGYDMNDDDELDPDNDYIIDPENGKLDIDMDGEIEGEYPGIDVDGDGEVDVWDMNKNGEVDAFDESDPGSAIDSYTNDNADWYIDHVAYNDEDYEDGIFYPLKELYYPNTSIMVLACQPGSYNSSRYIYQEDSHATHQYMDTETEYDMSDEAKIIYQSPGINVSEFWHERPFNNGSFLLSGTGTDLYKGIQKFDMDWDLLEEARKASESGDDSFYGKEEEAEQTPLREMADTWRDQIWLWANSHARAAIGRNMALEWCIGWLGCPGGMLESHTWFVNEPMALEITSFAGRLDIGKPGIQADCLVHYAECMLNLDWHGSDETGKSITDMMYEDMSIRYMNVVHHGAFGCGGDFDNSSIAAAAVSWAWLKGHNQDADVNLSVLDGTGCPKAYLCTSLYCAVHDIVLPGDGYYSSCDRGAATAVLASGSDDEFPAGNPKMQFDYMTTANAIWQDTGSVSSAWGSIEPGDIICSSTADPRHIIVFVGPDAVYEKWGQGVGDAEKAVVHSSHSSNLSSSRGPRCDLDGSFVTSDSSHAYHVFRCMNTDNASSSEKKAAVDAASGSLSGLNNGDGKGGAYYAPQY